jgi:MerR family transcriptional regulator, light-induced transcriptional regulator
MTDSDALAMPIGAVTQLTGISSHTLRKWESRYAAVAPVRTESGRRLYTQNQVRKLLQLRDLVRQGHQIGHLSTLSEAELEALADEGAIPPAESAEPDVDRVIVVGEVLSAVLQQELAGPDAILIAAPADPWLTAPEVSASRGKQALVVELPTLSEPSIGSLIRLRRTTFARVIVVYGFAPRKKLARLADSGIVCLKAPVNAAQLLRNLRTTRPAVTNLAALEQSAIPARRFSANAIAKLAAMSPKIQCECPNHIAQLVLDISAFEQYSLECEQAEPEERALHGRLRTIAAHARALFEEAMANVAVYEGIEIEEL